MPVRRSHKVVLDTDDEFEESGGFSDSVDLFVGETPEVLEKARQQLPNMQPVKPSRAPRQAESEDTHNVTRKRKPTPFENEMDAETISKASEFSQRKYARKSAPAVRPHRMYAPRPENTVAPPKPVADLQNQISILEQIVAASGHDPSVL
ncbi:hypothetical protein LTR56_009626 [Elasticomyces elasticus]|nr:hypothetical protein LTR56_009626 [Elasticomyces elasticus]KAK3660126.1 hypothetical protein LTR22_008133 [Elasticomyces elasticus]KAK4923431.1 hypothetical protein LTR49_009305 [Elasticomyces elasticus]KAK5752303.1 hypothetical protein LTS12_017604 [Elasticomyces elasticus]